MVKLTVTRPPNCQSAFPATNGSFFGPPCSPVLGLTSLSNSGLGPFLMSWCKFSSAFCSSLGIVPTVWLALRRASNSACSAGGRGGGPGRLKEGGARKKEGVVWTDFESIRRAKKGRSEMCETMLLTICCLGTEDVVAKSCKEWKLSFGGSGYEGQARVEVVQRREAYV